MTDPRPVPFRTEGRQHENIIGSYGPLRSAEAALENGGMLRVHTSTTDGEVNGRTATVRLEGPGIAGQIQIVDGQVRMAYRITPEGTERVTIDAAQARTIAQLVQQAAAVRPYERLPVLDTNEITGISQATTSALRSAQPRETRLFGY